jgi:hypothetical protein
VQTLQVSSPGMPCQHAQAPISTPDVSDECITYTSSCQLLRNQ